MPGVRKQIAISDGSVKRRSASSANVLARLLFLTSAMSGCGPMIESAPFPVRPDSVRPADLLGPYDGIVIDADSDRPIAGATVAATWAFERGIGLAAPAGGRGVVRPPGAGRPGGGRQREEVPPRPPMARRRLPRPLSPRRPARPGRPAPF